MAASGNCLLSEGLRRRTILNRGELSGPTISGEISRLIFHPYDRGIVFLNKGRRYHLSPEIVSVRDHKVSIGPVGMVEHLLAVLLGLKIDCILVEVLGRELPIFDGSAREYFRSLTGLGTYELDQPQRVFPLDEMELTYRGSRISVIPGSRLEITIIYDPHHPKLPRQNLSFSSITNLVWARTFAFVQPDDPRLTNYRFGLGITREGIRPPPRSPDEPIRHKLLDLIGDLYTLGQPFSGTILAYNPNHRLNIGLVRLQHQKGYNR